MSDLEIKRTSDLQDLVAAFETNSLVSPRSGAPSVVDLSAAVFAWAGTPEPYLNAKSQAIGTHFADAAHLVFFVADGLGMCFINRTSPASVLRQHLVAELQTVFPSTTPAVMTSLATAAWPNTHGIVGWDVYLDEIDAVATIIRFQRRRDGEPLDRLGVSEHQAYPLPSLCGSIQGGLVSVTPKHLAGTTFSDYWTGRNARFIGYESLAEGVEEVLTVSNSGGLRRVTCLYTDVVDSAAHGFGVDAPETLAALEQIEQSVERLASGLPPNARVVLTADHGLLDGPIHEILPGDPIVRHLRHEPWGDNRQMHFAVHHERVDVFEAEFRQRYGHISFLLTVEEVEALELLGPGSIQPATRKRLGTHIAISRGADALSYKAVDDSASSIGIHSGLTPDEMLVPLIIV